MSVDRSWMEKRLNDRRGLSDEFRDGVRVFIEYAFKNEAFVDNQRIKCPCRDCNLLHWGEADEVKLHLFRKGFMRNYTIWTQHGESIDLSSSVIGQDNASEYRNIVIDAGRAEFDIDDYLDDPDVAIPEEPNLKAQKFYELLRDADEPLWDGAKKHTRLSAVTRLLHLKSEHGLSDKGFDGFLTLIKEFLPDSEKLPGSYYDTKKMMMKLGLGYEKIEACSNDCVLFWKENKDKLKCPICDHSRYKPRKGSKKNVAWKTLRYFPITLRLQRLYYSRKTAEYMTYYNTRSKEDGVMRHPSDGEAWKHFDLKHPDFAQEVRNVRLGLATDGFNPFGHSSTPYSTWPVIVVPYNLPPNMCMKQPYTFMSLLIPGPKSPGRNIDVYLRPLIDELKMLWDTGVSTFDVFKRQNFQMRAAVMWTVNDFPAHGIFAGWSTHGKLACPCCMHMNQGFTLKYGGKVSFFGCHRKMLPEDHPFRKQKDKFDKTIERGVIKQDRLSGDEVWENVNKHDAIPFGKGFANQKIPGFGKTHNWTKQSIFWELSYWKTLLVRHTLDVMHIEKNVFDNIFNTVMNVKGKSKDHLKARKDLQKMGIRPELHPKLINGKTILPKASYTLDKKQIQQVCEWVKNLKLPDGYASNISRCCNLLECKFYGMKSHDCHVFMQRLIPIAFRDFLPKAVMDALTELCHFFRDLCSVALRETDMKILEKSIVEAICKLEKIFPPSFFDSMEHLPVHLAYEARVSGPVQYRWMYPFERFMFGLKKKVRNKARVEGSIAEAYIIEELVNFSSLYFESEVETRINRLYRNEDVVDTDSEGRLSIFTHSGRPFGSYITRWLSDEEYDAASLYVLLNCKEVIPFIDEFDNEARVANSAISDKELEELRNNEFLTWFKQRVDKVDQVVDTRFKELACGPSRLVRCYKGYIVNGFRFNTVDIDSTKQTQNNGVLVNGDCYNDNCLDFYGRLDEVVELDYMGSRNQLAMFKCHWFDITSRAGVRVSQHGIVDVNLKSRLGSNEPFVFANQASQVFYAESVSKKNSNWCTIIKTKKLAVGNYQEDVPETYQEDATPVVVPIPVDDDTDDIPLQAVSMPDEVMGEEEDEDEDEDDADDNEEEEEEDDDEEVDVSSSDND